MDASSESLDALLDPLPPVPFAHRVQSGSGAVCMGDYWIPNVSNLADAVFQLGRFMNFDEPRPVGPSWDRGLNPAAAGYWEKELGFAPIDPALEWPLVNSVSASGAGSFRPAQKVRRVR